MRRIKRRAKAEPTIALINVVFLMLIFFLVAGTVAQPLDGRLNLISTAQLDGRAPPDALIVFPDGRLSHQGQEITDTATYLATLPEAARLEVRLVPDRALPAVQLVEISRSLRAAGADSVIIVTERALP